MRSKTAVLLIAAAALACRGRSGPAQRTQQQYDVVQEGQSTSATTSVGVPGEVPPPVATATNTDTTGSFTLGTTPVAANMPGGPATGVLPPQQPGAMASGMPQPMASAPAAPAPAPRAVTIVRTPSQPPVLTNTQAPPRTTERRPPPPANATTSSDTAATSTTDTAATDTTSTDEKPKKDDNKKKDSGEKTDTSAPPPTQTDTIGGH